MKQQIVAPNSVPTANIAVNKSRLKVYKNAGSLPTYYLQKGQEFQIELANPTSDVVLAKIILNGKAISQGGLVLNPGQRIFLDRYLDVAKKFLFDTYEVSGSAEMKAAIANNGDIKVEFYRESIPYYNPFPLGTITLGNYGGTGTYYNSGTPFNHLTSGSSLPLLNNITNLSNHLNDAGSIQCNASSYTSSVDIGPTLDMLDNTFSKELKPSSIRKKALLSKSIETGRVEKGSESDQKLKYVNKEFDYYAFHTVEYKILPVSQKINTVEDINVRRYCGNCGTKVPKLDNFCGHCGRKY